MSHPLVSFTEEDARPELLRIPSTLDYAIQAGNAAAQMMMCALDLDGEDKTEAMVNAKKLCFRAAALLTRAIEGVE
jgi:hypothetical protein